MLWGEIRWLNREDETFFLLISKEKALFTTARSEDEARKNFRARILLGLKRQNPQNYPLRHHDILLDYADFKAL